MTDHILTQQQDGVLHIVLRRPEKKNALTNAMYAAIADALEAAQTDPAVRVVLFRAEGDCFSAGNDIMDFASVATSAADFASMPVARVLKALAFAEKPLVAAVQGAAVGIGTTLLLHCDLVYAAEDAQLSTPFINLALVPEAASSLLMPARIGHVRAYAMFALGEKLSGVEAVRLGLANAAVPADQLAETALTAARALTQRPPEALRLSKRLMRDAETYARIMEVEGAQFMARLRSPEAQEAFAAFLQRRTPDFTKFA